MNIGEVDSIPYFRCTDENCYKINVTSWFGPIELVQPTYGYILPQLIFITLIFNSLIILVLTRSENIDMAQFVVLPCMMTY